MRLFPIVLLVLACAAAQAAPDTQLVTETQFLSAFHRDHPARVALEGRIGNAQADALGARTLDNPELVVIREAPEDIEQFDVLLSWQLPRTSRGLMADAADHRVSAAQSQVAQEHLSLRLTLRKVFAEWALHRRRAERLADLGDSFEELAERQRLRAELGETSDLEAWRLSLAAVEVYSWRAQAEARAQVARSQALGWRPDLPASAVPVWPALPPATKPDWSTHPQLVHLEEKIAAAELEERAASHIARLPSLTAGWQRQSLDTHDLDGLVLGLSWPIPLLDRNQAQELGSAVEVEATRARIDIARHRIESERESAVGSYRSLHAAALEASRRTSATQRVVKAAVAAFDHGESTFTDLLETLRSVAQAELAALELHDAALTAHRQLERVAGQPLELLGPVTEERNGDQP